MTIAPRIRPVILALGAVVILLFSGCEEAGNDTTGSIRLRVYSDNFSPEELDDTLGIEPIVQIDPAINDRDVFVGDGSGTIVIADVPPGTYTVHPAFYASSIDVSIDVTVGDEAEESIELPAVGMYYYLVNTGSDVPALADHNVRNALAVALDRQALVDAIADDFTLALNLVPTELRNDGITGLDAIVESTAAAESALTPTTAFSFNVLYNDSTDHAAIATEFKSQIEALTKVTLVSLTSQAWETYLETRNDFSFDVARAGWILDSNNILNYFEALMDQSGLSHSTIESKIAEAQMALSDGDLAQHAVLLVELNDLLLEQMIAIPMYYY